MAQGKWWDFNDKYGFDDGNSATTRDRLARDILVRKLNESLPEDIVAVEYDRPGVHNPVLLYLVDLRGKKRLSIKELRRIVRLVHSGEARETREGKDLDHWLGDEARLPADIEDVIEEIVADSYVEADQQIATGIPSEKRWGSRR